MISRTSKIWSKSGPVTLPIITTMLQRIQEKYGIILEKYYVCQSGTQDFVHISEKMYVLGTRVFRVFLDVVRFCCEKVIT